MSFTRRALLAGTAAALSTHGLLLRFGDADMTEDGVLELRQYTLFGGKRDKLISIFEKNFIEPQNALGAHVLGTFRDVDDPDRFVWLRGFRDMPARQKALEAFYGGPFGPPTRTTPTARWSIRTTFCSFARHRQDGGSGSR